MSPDAILCSRTPTRIPALARSVAQLVLLFACACSNKSSEPPPVSPKERLAEIDKLIAAKDGAAALAAIERYFPNDTSPPIAEDRARAHEAVLASCTTDACRFAEASSANAAHGTPDRAKQIDAVRPKLVAALSVEQVTEKQLLPRLKQVRSLADAATATQNIAGGDADLQARAKTAAAFADSEFGKVALLKMELPVVESVLGPSKMNEKNVPAISLDGITAFISLDANGKCAGIFAVGSSAGKRAYKSATWPADRLLSQAVGKPATIRPPTAGSAMSKWSEAGVPVVARWRNGEIVELRIGDAAP